ncbi:hypothetical protein [Rhizobium herbae]
MNVPVIRYRPMEFDLRAGATSARIRCLVMELISGANVLKACFSVAGQREFVKVVFPHADIFRVIDDMHLPLEEDDDLIIGHVSNHFAYRVDGAPFWSQQQEVLEAVSPGSTHYRFVTGGSCLDVISSHEPVIGWVMETHG